MRGNLENNLVPRISIEVYDWTCFMKNLSSHREVWRGREEMTSIWKCVGMAMVEAREAIEQSGKTSVLPEGNHSPDPDT